MPTSNHVTSALKALKAGGDFADELIVGFARKEGCSALASFDMALKESHPRLVVPPK